MLYFYSSNCVGAPQLNNQWGDFNKIINYLIDGGENVSMSTVEWIGVGKVKISSATAIGFKKAQTIIVTGCTIEGFNGEYFIESFSPDYMSMNCYRSDLPDNLGLDDSSAIQARIRPCGIERVFGGVDDLRTVIKTRSGVHFRIDDRNVYSMMTPVQNAGTHWMKFARICMADSFLGLDELDYENVNVFPFNPQRPNENIQPDGLYCGQAFITHNFVPFPYRSYTSAQPETTYTSINNTSSQYTSSSSNRLEWNIYANDEVIYIYLHSYFTHDAINGWDVAHSRSYVIGEYDCISNELKNGYMTFDCWNSTNYTYQFTTSFRYYISPREHTGSSNAYRPIIGSIISNSYNQCSGAIFGINGCIDITNRQSPKFAPIGMLRSDLTSGNSLTSPMGFPNSVDGKIYTSDIILCHGSTYYGDMKHIKWILSNVGSYATPTVGNILDGDIVVIDNVYYICAKNSSAFVSGYSYHTNRNSWVLMRLKR